MEQQENFSRGVIALDIDGTITSSADSLSQDVILFLEKLMQEGWAVIFLTGRTFSFALPLLAKFRSTYYLAVQNGAAVCSMPSQKLLNRQYISAEMLPILEKICQQEGMGLLVEAGMEYRDMCYYNPSDFSSEMHSYL